MLTGGRRQLKWSGQRKSKNNSEINSRISWRWMLLKTGFFRTAKICCSEFQLELWVNFRLKFGFVRGN